MIVLTRLDGQRFAVNDEHLERVEETPTTVLTLVNGNRYTVLERLDDVLAAIVAFRARVHTSAAGAVELVPGEHRPRAGHLVPVPDPDAPEVPR